jgi:hypothetical protein
MVRMSQELPAPPPQPRIPVTPAAPGVTIVTPGTFTRQDLAALKARGSELSRQINSATDRRRQTRDELKSATGADKAGLEQRLGVLDARIARLETDIDENGKAIVRATSVATTGPSFNPGNQNFNRMANNMVPIVAIFTIFVLAPIALSISRMLWKRGSLPRQIAQSPENAQRLERIEQAIDAIAIEMERVSEGQRFVTRIMSESRSVGDGQRAAQPLSIPIGEKSATPRA